MNEWMNEWIRTRTWIRKYMDKEENRQTSTSTMGHFVAICRLPSNRTLRLSIKKSVEPKQRTAGQEISWQKAASTFYHARSQLLNFKSPSIVMHQNFTFSFPMPSPASWGDSKHSRASEAAMLRWRKRPPAAAAAAAAMVLLSLRFCEAMWVGKMLRDLLEKWYRNGWIAHCSMPLRS